jgi:hypothetical protein
MSLIEAFIALSITLLIAGGIFKTLLDAAPLLKHLREKETSALNCLEKSVVLGGSFFTFYLCDSGELILP